MSDRRAARQLCARLAPAAALLAGVLGACSPMATDEPAPGVVPAPTTVPASAPDALDGGDWQVVDIGGQPLVADSTPTLQFRAGRLAGTGGCNRFMGSYETSGGASMHTGELASTMMACAGPLMEQEDRYLRLLGQVNTYRIEGDLLLLRDSEGQTIRARRQPGQQP